MNVELIRSAGMFQVVINGRPTGVEMEKPDAYTVKNWLTENLDELKTYFNLLNALERKEKKKMEKPVDKNAEKFDKLEQDLKIEMADITGELCRQPSLFVRHALTAASYRSKVKREDNLLKVLEGKLNIEYRDKHEAAGTKYTEGLIASEVRSDERYVAAIENFSSLTAKSLAAEAVADAWRQRADMLVNVSADAREEKKRNNYKTQE